MTLTLTLRAQPPARVRADALTPDRLDGMDPAEVAALTVPCGRDAVAVGELFEVSGSPADLDDDADDDGAVLVAGELSLVDGLGAGMTAGRMTIAGSCGDRAGAGMSGGELRVAGDVGGWAGAEMAGGLLAIDGDAGPRLGAAAVGARSGMSGGEIVVTGSAGEETGAGMRRGLVGVGGSTGAGAGLRMLAGTVIALGGLGADAGLGNKRGSLVSGRPLQPAPGYAFATRYRPPALALQLQRLRALGLTVDDALLVMPWARWSGDRNELRRGEILIFEPVGGQTPQLGGGPPTTPQQPPNAPPTTRS